MRPAPRPRWHQATALVSLGAGGVVTGLSFVPASSAEVTSPAALPFALMALEKSAKTAPSDDAVLRSAIVHIARHFLRMAEGKTPAEMEAIIWRHASLDGADHGPSCAAFASLTLALGSHVAGHESWVTGGTSYPWPLHAWADARVDPNPASPNVMSVLQDAQDHHRWHALGDGYDPQPGDWVLFDGHVEVVTSYDAGVLRTIGGDSLPNYSVNAHSYPGPLSGQGVAGFVDNGLQPTASAPSGGQAASPGGYHAPARPASAAPAAPKSSATPPARAASAPLRAAASAAGSPVALAPRAIEVPPEVPQSSLAQSRVLVEANAEKSPATGPDAQPARPARAQDTARPAAKSAQPRRQPRGHTIQAGGAGRPAHVVQGWRSGKADIPGTGLRPAPAAPQARPGQAEIPGLLKRAPRPAAPPRTAASPRELAPYRRHLAAPAAQPAAPGSAFQRAFIEQVAPGAIATQHKYGVPASVTIAQAIDESAWGQSILATHDRNLFGIKGTGPAGSDLLPTQEFTGGQLVDTTAPFRVYNDIGQSIEDHGRLLARSDYFTNAMANRHQPNAFAAALTGVYATDPSYGAKLIELMQHYNLYRFDVAAAARNGSSGAAGGAAIPGISGDGSPAQSRGASASAAQPASASSAGAGATRSRGGATSPAPASQPGNDRALGRAARSAWRQGAGGHDSAAGRAQRAGLADGGSLPGGAIPGTAYPMPAVRSAKAPADQAARPGQADIPGLPGAVAAPAGHRPRNTRPRPAHPSASGRRPAGTQPVGGAAAQGGQQSSSPASPAPGWAKPERAMPGPVVPAPAMPPVAKANDRSRRGPLAQVASPGEGLAPGPAGDSPSQPAAGPASRMTARLGESLIPGIPPELAGPAGTAHGSGAMPPHGEVPPQGAAPEDGAWIPGLPGRGADTARHARHRTAASRHGAAVIWAGHGTNLAPTRARRFAPAGRPAAQPGRRAASASHAPAPAATPALPPVSAQPGAAPAAAPQATAPATAPPRGSLIPGLSDGGPASGRRTAPAPVAPSSTPGPAPASARDIPGGAPARPASPTAPAPARGAGATYGAGEPMPAVTTAVTAVRYSHHLPPAVGKAYLNSAKVPLVRGEPLYIDVATQRGLSWEILAACDWMQCKAKPGLSPVYGEKLGTVNPDGTSYRTRSAALERCAYDLVELARSVYHIDLTRGDPLSVRELANAFAAFRWGGLLKHHHTSAMEFPYSVAGLTTQHMHMRWPNIDDPQAPDKPGARFHQPFGAVPLVLSLNYPATA